MTPVVPDDSILETMRKALNLEKDDDSFDTEILLYINAGIGDLNQAGVGNQIYVSDTEAKWSDLIRNDDTNTVSMKLFGTAQLYVFLKTKVGFDPPQVNTQNVMVDAMNQAIWRLAASWDEEYYDRSDSKGGEEDGD